jgi:hypothetical protein
VLMFVSETLDTGHETRPRAGFELIQHGCWVRFAVSHVVLSPINCVSHSYLPEHCMLRPSSSDILLGVAYVASRHIP